MIKSRLLGSFLVCFFIWPTPSLAGHAVGCAPFERATITIRTVPSSPKIDSTRSLLAIRAMAHNEDPGKFSSASHETPVGLTAASLRFDSSYQITSRVSPRTGRVCAQISSFDLTFGFDNTIVYLARELPYGSCSYQTVMKHEYQHVQIDQNIVQFFGNRFHGLIDQAIKDIGVVDAASATEAEDHIRSTIKAYMKDLSYNLASMRTQEQGKIDTPEEYKRLSKSCNGKLSELIKQFYYR
jgi:hypothetical protein